MTCKTLLFILFAAMLSTPICVLAVLVTQPLGLNPGDQYQLAFVTSSSRDATSHDIGDYNTFVTGAANSQPALVALGTTWTAIASTVFVPAIANTGTASGGLPVFLLDGSKLADDYIDLWDGSVDVPLAINESGQLALGGSVWTGTSPDGIPTAEPLGSSVSSTFGDFNSITSDEITPTSRRDRA